MIIGLELRHFKTYKGQKYIPITKIDERFSSFIGDNGIGKSSILEALNVLFNDYVEWNINQEARNERGLSEKTRNQPYIMGIFCLPKSKIPSKYRNIFQSINDYLLKEKKEPILKDLLNESKIDDYYILVAGKQKHNGKADTVYFGSYDNEIRTIILKSNGITDEEIKSDNQRTLAKIHKKLDEYVKSVLSFYSYIYIPTEVSISEFSRIEKDDIQKLTGTNIYNEIENIITIKKLNDINNKLSNLIDNNIAKELGSYKFITKNSLKNITMNSLIQKIIEEYFSLRIMVKESENQENIKVENLSSGEKRKALIELSYAFLKTQNYGDKYIILAVDEPEASLNTNARFKQFEDLNAIKNISDNIQTIISTHWYGHLSILNQGVVNLIYKKDEKIAIDSFDLFNLTEKISQLKKHDFKSLPNDISLKSINDLTQSIISSLQTDKPYNWLICEGSSEKIYFDFYFKDLKENKNLRILPVGGFKEVKKIYEHLQLPLKDYSKAIKGKVYCLIDTDKQLFDFSPSEENTSIIFRRILNDNAKTNLVKNNYNITFPTEIEDCLNGEVFKKTIEIFDKNIQEILTDPKNIKDNSKNSYYYFDLRDSDREIIKKFFDKDYGYMKITFAKKYVEEIEKSLLYGVEYEVPSWIDEIKSFFE